MIEALSNVVTEQVKDFAITQNLIQTELNGIFGSNMMRDLQHTLKMYKAYYNGADFNPEGNGDVTPANHRYKTIKTLIDKEARFLFSIPPTITIEPTDLGKANQDVLTQETQYLVDKVLEHNNFNSNLVRVCKEYLIGKRIAIAVDFNEEGIILSLMPSLEFIHETSPTNANKLTKFIRVYNIEVNDSKDDQRVYKKKWELNEQGFCVITEEVYNGSGILVETLKEPTVTPLTYIPVWVVVNEGLIGDPFGVSEVEGLMDDESWYSKLGSKDIDSLRKGTDQIVYAMDVHPKSTKNLSRSAGSFWDLSTDPAAPEGSKGQVGVLDNDMSYSPALDTTLKRLRASMHAQVDVPDTSSDALTGIITSGKTMKAIYWGLMVRCDEKLLDWLPALRGVVKCIIEGSKLYPESKAIYTDRELLEDYSITIKNTYPILEDEIEEKSINIAEVNSKVMSRKAYMKRWRGLTDDEIAKELEQIALEQQTLSEDNFPSVRELGEE